MKLEQQVDLYPFSEVRTETPGIFHLPKHTPGVPKVVLLDF